MRMFTQYLEGEVIKWFRDLAPNSISPWIYFIDIFLNKWDERKTHHQYLCDFYAIKRRKDKTDTKFNRRFQNLYLSMPVDIQPSEANAKVYYTVAHHHELTFYLRERKSPTLEHMFTDVEEIENNLRACEKLPNQIMNEGVTSKNQKEEGRQRQPDFDISPVQNIENYQETVLLKRSRQQTSMF